MNKTITAGKEAENHLIAAAREFQKCMRCGKCRSVCPVFRELGNELYVARGKNKLAEKIVSGDLDITARVEDAINQCLNCKTCSANCPAGVSPEHVVLRLRWYITTRKGLPFMKALIFRQLLWRKWPITLGCAVVGLAQRALFGIGPNNPVRYLFPLFGFPRRRNFPQLAIRSAQSQLPQVSPAKGGAARMRVAYFTGCAGNLIYTNVARSVVDVLTAYGCEVIIPKQQKCNGTPVLANGDYEGAKRLMEHNFDLFRKLDVDAIVVACSSCGLSLKKEIKVFVDDSPELSAFTGKVYDIHEFIAAHVDIADNQLGRLPYRVTYHDPCHLARGQGVRQQPRDILRRIPGVEFVEMKNADTCCGSAGSYCITHYDTAIKINNHKIKDIREAGVEVVATSCPTCVMHISDNLQQHKSDEKTRFVIEILADSLRAAGTI